MVVKLDMSKAYDRVKWAFLKEVMLQMGFTMEWATLIMKCISTVSYTVNINGRRGNVFKPTRGLRQGDPLSPFLFLICSKGISSLIRIAIAEGLMKGVRLTSYQSGFFCYEFWAIWGERNRRIHEQKNSTGQEIPDFINNYMAELNGLEMRNPIKGKEIRRWSYAPSEFVKINFDGAYDANHHQSASGIVVRNEEGVVLLSA
ncbi:hypothetical protein PVK06_036426 [Gossypium arboreum]|uniref:Reverse transcriptase domain-containing protein n=1 Tax=Gossypium arboreum TaxID=29729 RepID=A0ABR0NMP6_GOSAR|nr:hypothetical protein PVK06_036426 [Gossypium arboreum]